MFFRIGDETNYEFINLDTVFSVATAGRDLIQVQTESGYAREFGRDDAAALLSYLEANSVGKHNLALRVWNTIVNLAGGVGRGEAAADSACLVIFGPGWRDLISPVKGGTK